MNEIDKFLNGLGSDYILLIDKKDHTRQYTKAQGYFLLESILILVKLLAEKVPRKDVKQLLENMIEISYTKLN